MSFFRKIFSQSKATTPVAEDTSSDEARHLLEFESRRDKLLSALTSMSWNLSTNLG